MAVILLLFHLLNAYSSMIQTQTQGKYQAEAGRCIRSLQEGDRLETMASLPQAKGQVEEVQARAGYQSAKALRLGGFKAC